MNGLIVYELENEFCLIQQDDHAHVSGQIFDYMKREIIGNGNGKYESVRKAVYEHDRAWITMDEVPIWNDALHAPYSFINFPLPIKLLGYQHGIFLTAEDPYAGLLCSLHYTSFVKREDSTFAQRFIEQEDTRRLELKQETNSSNEEIKKHLSILQFLDTLSLLICYQEGKNNYYPFPFKGFGHSETFTPNKEQIKIKWLDVDKISITPSLFTDEFEVELKVKYVEKDKLDKHGIAKAYEEANWGKRVVKIV